MLANLTQTDFIFL